MPGTHSHSFTQQMLWVTTVYPGSGRPDLLHRQIVWHSSWGVSKNWEPALPVIQLLNKPSHIQGWKQQPSLILFTNVLWGQGSVSTVPFCSLQRITFTQLVFNSGHRLGSQLKNLNVAVQAPACFLSLQWLYLKKEQPKTEVWKRPVS